MTQTDKEETTVDENTDTFSSTLEFDGNYPLTSTGDKLEGVYHQEQTYFCQFTSGSKQCQWKSRAFTFLNTLKT